MARRKSRKKRSSTGGMRKNSCKIVSTPAGKRKLCKGRDGKVKFRKMSFSPR